MKFTDTQLKYLLILDRLSENGRVRIVDIAKEFNINRSSAFNMLLKLQDAGLVVKNENRSVELTGEGRNLAEILRKEVKAVQEKLIKYFGMDTENSEECALIVMSYMKNGQAE